MAVIIVYEISDIVIKGKYYLQLIWCGQCQCHKFKVLFSYGIKMSTVSWIMPKKVSGIGWCS